MIIRRLTSTAILTAALTSGLALSTDAIAAANQPAPQAPTTQVATPATSPASITESVLNQVLGSMGRINLLARTRISASKKNGFAINEFVGRVQVPFQKKIVIQTLNEPSGSTGDQLAPVIYVDTENLIVDLQANTDKDSKDAIDSQITFRRMGEKNPVPLIVMAKNKLSEIFRLEMHSINFKLDGLHADSGTVHVRGTCRMKQNQVDVDKNTVQLKTSLCEFSGYFTKAGDDYDFNLTYDSISK